MNRPIRREGDAVKPSWESFGAFDKADADFLAKRPDVVEEGRFSLLRRVRSGVKQPATEPDKAD